MSVHNYSNFEDSVEDLARGAMSTFPDHGINVSLDGTDLTVTASPDLDAGEITTLDGLVSSVPVFKDYQIYEYVTDSLVPDRTVFPAHIDYRTQINQKLHPQKIKQYGFLTSIIWYEEEVDNEDGTFTYNSPVVKESFSQTYDSDSGLPAIRTQEIQWYFTDGTLGSRKKTRIESCKNDIAAAIAAIQRIRKSNVLDIIDILILQILWTEDQKETPAFTTVAEVIAEGRVFFEAYYLERDLYEADGNYNFAQAMKDDAIFAWLDNDPSGMGYTQTKIRDYIVNQLTKGDEFS